MQCSNCGAPMIPIPNRREFRCEFCGATRLPQRPPGNADGVMSLGRSSDRDCPRCRTGLMQGALEGVTVDHCEACEGVLLETEAFAALIRRRRAEYGGADDVPRPLDRAQLERRIDCPACGTVMETHPYYGPGNAVIDSCRRCRLVWLDAGEIGAIERAPGRR